MGNVNDAIRNCERENNVPSVREIVLEFEVKVKDKSFQCTLLTDNGCNETNTALCVEENPDYVWKRLRGIRSTIHIIEEIGENVDSEDTFRNFSRYKEVNREAKKSPDAIIRGKARTCSSLNEHSSHSPIMYVGTFTTGVGARIKQQMGGNNKHTSMLHLKYWFTGKCRITIRQYDLSREELNNLSCDERDALLREKLNIIKGCLFDRLNPAFGGREDNNR